MFCVFIGFHKKGEFHVSQTQNSTYFFLPEALLDPRSQRMTSRRAQPPRCPRPSTPWGQPGWGSQRPASPRDPGRRPWRARSSPWTRRSKAWPSRALAWRSLPAGPSLRVLLRESAAGTSTRALVPLRGPVLARATRPSCLCPQGRGIPRRSPRPPLGLLLALAIRTVHLLFRYFGKRLQVTVRYARSKVTL